MAKTWSEKFNDPRPHQVKPAPLDIAGMKKGEIMLIPSPKIIDAFIRTIPKGTGMDVPTLRKKLAKKYKAQVTCPITTGFHLRAVAAPQNPPRKIAVQSSVRPDPAPARTG